VNCFLTLSKTAGEQWRKYKYALVFAPDRGAHFDEVTNRGDHGLSIPDDIHLSHFYDISTRFIEAIPRCNHARIRHVHSANARLVLRAFAERTLAHRIFS
jgi:hypothetical protein